MIRPRFGYAPALGALLALSACGGSTTPPIASGTVSTSTLVQTDKGPVQGISSSGVRVWMGIPYAAPPTGANRFAPLQPRAAWTTALDASKPGPICPQNGATAQNTTEDCLYLNVYAPPATANAPVYVFVHAGGLQGGAGSLYDGSLLAQTGQIIVVTVNYRLGIFGWLANAVKIPGTATPGTTDSRISRPRCAG